MEPASSVPSGELVRLEAEARFRRDRLALYRARIYGGRSTSLPRLRELERESEAASARLAAARSR